MFTHTQFRADIDAEMVRNPRPSLHIVYVDVESRLDSWEPAKSEKGIRLHYRLWQKSALDHVRQLHGQAPFDLVHHVSWGSLQQPPLLWKLKIPFVWGPIGGGQTWPGGFGAYGGDKLAERARNMLVRLSRFNPSVVRSVKSADLIFTTNLETDQLVKRLGGRRVELYFDNGIAEELLETTVPPPTGTAVGGLKMIWGGRCEPRKGLPLALEAMAKIDNPEVCLTVAGDGPSKPDWQAMAERLGLGRRVRFLGKVPRAELLEMFRASDAFLFTSLRDSTGSIVLEALAKGLPIITLGHQGIGCLVTNKTGIKVPVTTPMDTINGLASAMQRLAADPLERRRMAQAALELAGTHVWHRRADRMNAWYKEVLNARRNH